MEKKYTKVNYKKIWDEIAKFEKYSLELTKDDPDYNSHVWQVADNMAQALLTIKARAVRLEKAFNN